MFLSNYVSAINYLLEVLGPKAANYTFESICPSFVGDTWLFFIKGSEAYFKVYVRSGVVVEEYNDTWRNPKHRKIICGGKK